MILDAALPPVPLNQVREIARAAEQLGFTALWSSETLHDPFLSAAMIAEHTQKLCLGTAVAIAFARSPANLAYTAWDLAQASSGRFILGLGTQVKAHVERRFGMPWPDSVVGKLREQIGAIRSLWNTWQNGVPLNFQGEYYQLSLMSPFFNPGPIAYPEIPIYIAGVNTGLARLAGECADGFLVHPFHSPAYLQESILPAIWEGQKKAGRARQDTAISLTVFVATSPEEANFVRAQIAFYASTPSYRAVMRLHGWEETAQQLSSMAARKRWGEMPALINDEMLNTFALVCEPDKLAEGLTQRYAGWVDRISLYTPFTPGDRDEFWQSLITNLNTLP
jgi:probable F420-dependent oxidoreductase